MVNARPPIPPSDPDSGLRPAGGSRFNVLLTEDRQRPVEHWTRQLPRLVAPLGIHAQLATSAREAAALAEQQLFHAVITDLATPVEPASPRGDGSGSTEDPASGGGGTSGGGGEGGGLWLLQVLQRRAQRPPVIVVNSRATRQQAVRLLNDALRLGAFSVINRPADLHPLLTAIQRLLNRHHQGQWPTPPLTPPSSTPTPN